MTRSHKVQRADGDPRAPGCVPVIRAGKVGEVAVLTGKDRDGNGFTVSASDVTGVRVTKLGTALSLKNGPPVYLDATFEEVMAVWNESKAVPPREEETA